MKLLYITEDRFPPFRADVVDLFAIKLTKLGHQIDWMMQPHEGESLSSGETDWLGNKVYLIRKLRRGGFTAKLLNALFSFFGDWKVFLLALKHRYDVIQVRDQFVTCLPAWVAARLSGARFCYWMSYPFPESRLYLARNRMTDRRVWFFFKGCVSYVILYGFIVKAADHIFVQSDQMFADMAKRGVPESKMSVVLMGIREEQVGALGKRSINSDSPMLLYLGTLVRIRRLEFLIEVVQNVCMSYPKAKLYFVGDGEKPSDRAFLEEEVRRRKLQDNVVFTGFLPMEEAWSYVESADICFSPFYPIPILLSTSPTKLIEYLAMGKAVVANEHPEQIKVMEESGVGHCVPWDVEAFSNEVIRMLDSPSETVKKASRGPEYVRQNRTYDVIASQVDATYRRILTQ